jgi:hypothetical protein
MFSRPMIDHLARFPIDDPDEVNVDRCIAAGIDVIRWTKSKALIAMFGPVAEAMHTGREIEAVIRSPECANDLSDAYRDCILAKMSRSEASTCIDAAKGTAQRMLADPHVWRAVQRLAERLPASGRLEGRSAVEIISSVLR